MFHSMMSSVLHPPAHPPGCCWASWPPFVSWLDDTWAVPSGLMLPFAPGFCWSCACCCCCGIACRGVVALVCCCCCWRGCCLAVGCIDTGPWPSVIGWDKSALMSSTMVCLNFLVNISSVLALELPPAVLAASVVGGGGFVLCSSSTCSKQIVLLMRARVHQMECQSR